MNSGRWYPGQVELADGRTVILGGYTDEAPGNVSADELELFTPADGLGGLGSLALQPSAQRKTALYPHLITLPDGNVLLAGPGRGLRAAPDHRFHLDRISTSPAGPNRRQRGAQPWVGSGLRQVTQIGGDDLQTVDANGTRHASASTATLDALHPFRSGWKTGPSLNLPRSYQNTVLLPDGSMVDPRRGHR